MLDAGNLTLTVELSYWSEDEQSIVATQEARVDEKTAKAIQMAAEEKYFSGMKAKEWTDLVMKALDAWFARRRLPMFDANDFKCLNTKCSQIINANEYDLTVMSRNRGHYW